MRNYLLTMALTAVSVFAHEEEKSFRIFDETSPQHVIDFYKANHAFQTLDFVLSKKQEYGALKKAQMGVWEAFALLETIVDESDPDIGLPQCYHAFQTAEALRKDGQPRWLILTGLLHDLGKMLTYFGEPQWAVVGDTFPVGCAYSDKVVFPAFFSENPDSNVPLYQSQNGIYTPGCGLSQIHMSWGHDEYLYYVMKDYLPKEALFIIRYHSFYALHFEDAYTDLLNEQDKVYLKWLKLFCGFDLYSKSDEKLDIDALLPYYQDLVAEFLPPRLSW